MGLPTAAFVGRGPELAVLNALVAGVQAGRGGVAWIEGEPGVGKTALVDLVAEQAAAAGCQVLRGAGDELMEPFPLRLMAECLRVSTHAVEELRVRIARLLQGDADAGIDPVLAASELMLALVDQLCMAGPVALIVEDLHWSDEPSLLIWNRLARSVDQIPLLLMGTCRPGSSRAAVGRLRAMAGSCGGVVLDVTPLVDTEVRQLAERLVGQPGPRLSRELERAGGIPLYVHELLEALVREGLVAINAGVAELTGDSQRLPRSLAESIERQLRFLPDSTLHSLRMAALLGNEFRARDWSAVIGLPVAEVTDVASQAMAGGVLNGDGDRLQFRHELIRQVLEGQTAPALRSDLHAHFASLLAAAGTRADTVARQLLAGPAVLDEWALDWLAAAPQSLLYTALGVSVDLLGRAFAQVSEDNPRWVALGTRLAQVLLWSGRNDEEACEVAARVAARVVDGEVAARMQVIAVRAAGRQGRYEKARTLASVVDDRFPLRFRAQLGAWEAMTLAYLGRADEGRRRVAESVADAERSGDGLTIGHAHHVAARLGDRRSALQHLDAALVALGNDPESLELRLQLYSRRIEELHRLGLSHEVQTTLATTRRLAEGVAGYVADWTTNLAAMIGYERGDWDEMLLTVDDPGLELSATEVRVLIHELAAMVALRREQPDRAQAYLAAVGMGKGPEPSLDNATPDVIMYLSEIRALQAEISGDLRRALECRKAWLDLSEPDRHRNSSRIIDLGISAARAGDSATGWQVVKACLANPYADGDTPMTVAGNCCKALLGDNAEELLRQAEECEQRVGWIVLRAQLLEEAAVRLAVTGDIARARTAFTDAVRIYDRLGATWDLRRADQRLRQYGIRRGPHTLHRRATTGWTALTPAELRVAQLVAGGMSNPGVAKELYLSRSTVQTHVSNILAKLQLRSRVQLAREFDRHESEARAAGRPEPS
ncbi:AAA family ATPase [Dactylosporangium sp. NPDC005572]|uniref:helix-turn-helix transcriptional regulator n=1 Tax=Dactylosporangium sp. NPDC005572 TaxID=3156889 RepID=UPI0033B57FBC